MEATNFRSGLFFLVLALLGAALIGAAATYMVTNVAGPDAPVCDEVDVQPMDSRCPAVPVIPDAPPRKDEELEPRRPSIPNADRRGVPEPDGPSIPDPDRPPPVTPDPSDPQNGPGELNPPDYPEGPPAPDGPVDAA
jgi:hypothetical protein